MVRASFTHNNVLSFFHLATHFFIWLRSFRIIHFQQYYLLFICEASTTDELIYLDSLLFFLGRIPTIRRQMMWYVRYYEESLTVSIVRHCYSTAEQKSLSLMFFTSLPDVGVLHPATGNVLVSSRVPFFGVLCLGCHSISSVLSVCY